MRKTDKYGGTYTVNVSTHVVFNPELSESEKSKIPHIVNTVWTLYGPEESEESSCPSRTK